MNQRYKFKTIIGIIIAVLAVALLYAGLNYIDTYGSVAPSEEEEDDAEEDLTYITLNEHEYVFDHPVKSYLFLGTDASGNEDAVGESYNGSMADFLLLMVIDEKAETYGMLQLNRDTMTRITMLQKDGSGYASAVMQLCTAHWYGGDKASSCENTVNAVSELLGGVPIDGYYALPMEQMQELNAAVGGVTLTFDEDYTDIDPAMTAGNTLKLTDEQAYKFVRARVGVGDGENTSRMKRQNLFLNAFVTTAKEQNATDPQFIVKLYDSLKAYSTADINMKIVSKLAQKMNSYTSKGLLSPAGELKIGQSLGDGIDHTEFYMDLDSLEEILLTLYPLTETENTDGEETEDESADTD